MFWSCPPFPYLCTRFREVKRSFLDILAVGGPRFFPSFFFLPFAERGGWGRGKQKKLKGFGGFEQNPYLCIRFLKRGLRAVRRQLVL